MDNKETVATIWLDVLGILTRSWALKWERKEKTGMTLPG